MNIHKLFGLLGFEHWNTGGNCTAFGHRIGENAYILVTDAEDAFAPADDTAQFTVGLYDEIVGDGPCAYNLDLQAAIRCVFEFADWDISAANIDAIISDAS